MTLRRMALPLVAVLLIVAVVVAMGLFSSSAACAAPIPGAPRYVPPLRTILITLAKTLGPGVVSFLLLAYGALGVQRIGRRWIALALAVAASLGVEVVALILVPRGCGGFPF